MMNTQHSFFKYSLLSLAIFNCHLAYASEQDLSQSAQSDADITDDSLKKLKALNAITVMASRGSDLKDMDMSTTIIQHQQIQNAPQTSIDQIINKIPGVFAPARLSTQIHPTGQLLNIRGFGTSTNGLTLVLLDGIPANDPYFRTINWAQIPKEQVERIEVIRGGGATSLWGNMAMGGVINIVTRTPQSGTDVYASYGSFNTTTYGVSQGFDVTDQLKIGFSYDGSYSDGYWQTPKKYRHPDMSKTQTQVDTFNVKAVYTPRERDEYSLALQSSQTQENGLQYRLAENQWDSYRVAFNGKTALSNTWDLHSIAWYQYNEMYTQNVSNSGYSLLTPKVGTPNISQKEKASYDSFGGSLSTSTNWKNLHDIKFGLDYRQIEIKDPLRIFNRDGQQGNITAEATNQFYGIFAQAMYRFDRIPLDMTLGLREDFWQASKAKTYGEYQGSGIDNHLADQDENHFSPRLGFKYHANDSFDVRGAAYKNFSAPGLNQMYRSFISGTNYTIPNTNLKAQTNGGVEFGFDFNRDALNVSGTYFYNKIKDYIDYATVQNDCNSANRFCQTGVSAATNLRQYINAGDAEMQGFELMADWQLTHHINVNAGYTYTKSELTKSKLSPTVAPTGQQLGQIPTWNATLGASWQASDKLNLNVQLREYAKYWNDTAHMQRNDGTFTADIGANYQASSKLQIYAVAQNLFGRDYYDQGLSHKADGSLNTSIIPAYAMPFNFTIGAKYHF